MSHASEHKVQRFLKNFKNMFQNKSQQQNISTSYTYLILVANSFHIQDISPENGNFSLSKRWKTFTIIRSLLPEAEFTH
jgi:hypothetical protein